MKRACVSFVENIQDRMAIDQAFNNLFDLSAGFSEGVLRSVDGVSSFTISDTEFLREKFFGFMNSACSAIGDKYWYFLLLEPSSYGRSRPAMVKVCSLADSWLITAGFGAPNIGDKVSIIENYSKAAIVSESSVFGVYFDRDYEVCLVVVSGRYGGLIRRLFSENFGDDAIMSVKECFSDNDFYSYLKDEERQQIISLYGFECKSS